MWDAAGKRAMEDCVIQRDEKSGLNSDVGTSSFLVPLCFNLISFCCSAVIPLPPLEALVRVSNLTWFSILCKVGLVDFFFCLPFFVFYSVIRIIKVL